jgi:hypothetical protein
VEGEGEGHLRAGPGDGVAGGDRGDDLGGCVDDHLDLLLGASVADGASVCSGDITSVSREAARGITLSG